MNALDSLKPSCRLRDPDLWRHGVLVVLLLAIVALALRLDPAFLRLESQLLLSTHIWELALLTIPMTFIIITAGIDLSVGATLALSAVVLGLSYEAGAPPLLAVLLALATGAVAGALNGFFVARLEVHPLIVTLATLAAFRGAAEGISLARPVSGFPDAFIAVGRGSVAGIPVPALIFVGLTIVAAVILRATPFGRAVYAIGHNETAARFSGIWVARVKWLIYTASGAMAGLAAVILVARRNTAKADLGSGLELDVITAVVLGGASIFGGRGGILGTLLGVILIHETREFVSWHWNRDELNLIVIGALLVVSVLVHRALTPASRGEEE